MFKAVLDANVLYPYFLRDLLIRIALKDLYKPLWTERIHDEWIISLLKNRDDLMKERLEYAKDLMNENMPDANIENYEDLIEGVVLPDPDDRHVLAAAIKANAEMIVTYNLKDFPKEILDQYYIEAIHPDDFILCQIDLNPGAVRAAILSVLKDLIKPPVNITEYLRILEKRGLTKTVSRLKAMGLEASILEQKSFHPTNGIVH